MPHSHASASIENKEIAQEQKSLSLFPLLAKTLGFTFLAFFGLFVLTLVVLGFWGYHRFTLFSEKLALTPLEIRQMAHAVTTTRPMQENGIVTFLVLGLDSLENRPESPPLTDSMLLVSVNLTSGAITQLSLPRDLWSAEYKTKINALYAYGQERNPEKPTEFPAVVLSELTGVPVQHVVTISLEDFAQVIDILGGVTITVAEGFIDERFPRSDVDVAMVTDPELLYETVVFEAGEHTFDAKRALQFVRSRNAQGEQGTDDARAARQQQIIDAIVKKLQQPQTWVTEEALVQLYWLYQERFASQLPLVEALAIGYSLKDSLETISLSSVQLSIYPEEPEGVIVHPPTSKHGGQWVYEVRDLPSFQLFIREKLLGISPNATIQ